MTRVGAVEYLNARPLVEAINPELIEVVTDHPRAIAQLLEDGDVDVALVPVAAVLAHPEWRVVPGLGIGADGPVHSVLLVAETPPEQWTSVLLDDVSRSSQMLSRLLLTEGPLKHVQADIRRVAPRTALEQAGGTTAALVIGDDAMDIDPRWTTRLDLAELWKQWTGLPFVFAVWAGRADVDPSIVTELRRAGEAGLARRDQYEGFARTYVTEFIHYTLGDRELMGLRRFAALAWQAGLLEQEVFSLYGPAVTRLDRAMDLESVLVRAGRGERISADEAQSVAERARLNELGMAARARRMALHPERKVTYLLAGRGELVAHDGVTAWSGEAPQPALQWMGPTIAELATQPAGRVAELASQGMVSLTDAPISPIAPGWARVVTECLAAGVEPQVSVWMDDRGPAGMVQDLLAIRAFADEHGIRCVTVHGPLPKGSLVQPGELTTDDWLRGVAVARLVLDNVLHIAASPVTQGSDMCQMALRYGADDFGAFGYGQWPSVSGRASHDVDVYAGERAIREAMWEPVRRDVHFEQLGGALINPRRMRPRHEWLK